ncbi:anthranilate phosphoribosyltransferase [Ectothiorhodospiraceae bacterium BW-2]|nr:anthranilate phosphoribosyltransferase [Ectothiorhodospiraceae bacterium BW-2]
MDMVTAIRRMVDRSALSRAEMEQVMALIMTGEATPAQIGGFLIGLRQKGETVDEITAAAAVMRRLATVVTVRGDRDHLIDTCGTGGDASGSFNISTTVALVVAAAGGRVAKHGNRSISSRSGSADLLEAAGVQLALTPEQVGQCIDEVGVGFMFAPAHHGAMKHAIGPRKEMGVRTIFNLLGPLTNPAGAPNQLLGVFDAIWVEPIAEVLQQLGSRHVMVVHAEDGLDEISIAAATKVAELKQGQISTYCITPEQFGLQRSSLASIQVDGVEESLAMVQSVLNGELGPARDIVLLNAAAALYLSNLAVDMAAGVAKAARVLDSGAAANRLRQLADLTQKLANAS